MNSSVLTIENNNNNNNDVDRVLRCNLFKSERKIKASWLSAVNSYRVINEVLIEYIMWCVVWMRLRPRRHRTCDWMIEWVCEWALLRYNRSISKQKGDDASLTITVNQIVFDSICQYCAAKDQHQRYCLKFYRDWLIHCESTNFIWSHRNENYEKNIAWKRYMTQNVPSCDRFRL